MNDARGPWVRYIRLLRAQEVGVPVRNPHGYLAHSGPQPSGSVRRGDGDVGLFSDDDLLELGEKRMMPVDVFSPYRHIQNGL